MNRVPNERGASRAGAVPWGELAVFAGISVGLCAVAAICSGLMERLGIPANGIAMCTPAIAVLIILAFAKDRHRLFRATAIASFGSRAAGYLAVAVLVPVVMAVVALGIATAVGAVDLDLRGFSGFRQALGVPAGDGFPDGPRVAAWLGTQLLGMLPLLVFSFGEEWAWRGYVLARLLPLGVWPALLLTSVFWAVWHGPLMWGLDPAMIALFLLALPAHAVVIGWARLASRSLWPAVVIHAANNSLTMIPLTMLGSSDHRFVLWLYAGGTGGVLGIVALMLCVGALPVTGQVRVRRDDPAIVN